jgi:hypothetical protein
MSIFDNTSSIMSRKGMKQKETQESEFIEDMSNENILEAGAVSFHPYQKQIIIETAITENNQKTYQLYEPSMELLKFMFVIGNVSLKKYIKHYITASNEATI